MIEAQEHGPEEKTTSPSTLGLFRCKGLELANLQERVSTALQLKENFSRTETSLDKLHAARNARVDRLSQTASELLEQLDNSNSSITCGAVYLKMRDELPNLSPNDFMGFFNFCLKSNTVLNKQSVGSVKTKGEQATFLRSISEMHARRLPAEYKKILDPMIDNPPEWFGKNKKGWELFVLLHANFTAYLASDEISKSFVTRHLPEKNILEELYGFTKQGEFPDWLSEESLMMPTKEEVETELAEDKEQKIKTINAMGKIKEQGKYSTTTSNDKTNRAIARLSDLVEEAFPNIANFADMILFLEILRKQRVFNVPFEKAIKDYANSYDILKISEPIALYIEKKLLEGKIIQSSQDLIDTNFTDLFTRFLESVKDEKSSSPSQFRDLKETNKKAYDALHYKIKPFLEVLSQSEITFLQELLLEYSGTATEEFIWDMAGLISLRFRKETIQLSKPQIGAFHDLSRFTASFLRNHSSFAYGQLHKSSENNFQEQEKLKPEGSLAVTATLREEIESTTEELIEGNLAGWRIFYAKNRDTQQEHLAEIGGESLEEREEALGSFLLSENVSSSIKPGSIIRAFEWLVTVPQEIEQIRIRKDIDGEVFKKLKRGKVRIFYVMDDIKKSIVFFVHQKQAQTYGF